MFLLDTNVISELRKAKSGKLGVFLFLFKFYFQTLLAPLIIKLMDNKTIRVRLLSSHFIVGCHLLSLITSMLVEYSKGLTKATMTEDHSRDRRKTRKTGELW